MMSSINRAIAIAVAAHAGQFDQGGEPYVFHPLRLMLQMKTEQAQIVAVLHDVVEDSNWTFDMLAAEGFSDEIIAAVDAMTKRAGESRLEAAARAVKNPLARIVKLADNADNSDLSRIPNPTVRDFARLEEYRKVRQLLLSAEYNKRLTVLPLHWLAKGCQSFALSAYWQNHILKSMRVYE